MNRAMSFIEWMYSIKNNYYADTSEMDKALDKFNNIDNVNTPSKRSVKSISKDTRDTR